MPIEVVERCGAQVWIDTNPARVLPIYRCLDVFNTDKNETPLEHLERFIGFLEASPRSFSIICMAQMKEETDHFEQEINFFEHEIAEIPWLLAMKQPENLEFLNTSLQQPGTVDNPLTGGVEDHKSYCLPALDYATAAVADCHDAGIPVSSGLLVRLQVALAG